MDMTLNFNTKFNYYTYTSLTTRQCINRIPTDEGDAIHTACTKNSSKWNK